MLTFQLLLWIIADVLSEEAILKWYKEAHVAKGKSVFLDQMKKFVEWLQNAEEGTVSFQLRYLIVSWQINISISLLVEPARNTTL